MLELKTGTPVNPPMGPALAHAVAAVARGGMVVVVDDEDRENEGDLVMAADHVTADAINFMVTHGRGLVCLPLAGAIVDRLGLPMMVAHNTARRGTAFTVSIEAVHGIDTGISAADRAATMRAAVAPGALPSDLASPGHVFPLRAAQGGVLARNGHTEASIDLAELAGCSSAAVICEIMNADGTMARTDDLRVFARQHDLPIVSIAELVAWRTAQADLLAWHVDSPSQDTGFREIAVTDLPSAFGGDALRAHAFRDARGTEHLALVKGNPATADVTLVRLHSECLTGDALGSLRCDCGSQLREGLARIAEAEAGVVVYVRGHEGRGIGLANKIRAYALQDQGLDTIDANHALGFGTDERDWSVAAAILSSLGVKTIDLLSNNPDKQDALTRRGFVVRQRIQTESTPTRFNRFYLDTKRTRMGHDLSVAMAGTV